MEPQSTCLVPIPGLLIHSINQNNSITPKSSVDLRGANSISMILCHNPDQCILIPGSSHDTVTRYFPFRWSRSACSYVVFVWLHYCKPRFLYCFLYIYKFFCKSIDIYHRPALIFWYLYHVDLLIPQTMGVVNPMLVYCWSTVCDAGPKLNQHWLVFVGSILPSIIAIICPGSFSSGYILICILALPFSDDNTHKFCIPVSTKDLCIAGSMLGHRLRRWPNI